MILADFKEGIYSPISVVDAGQTALNIGAGPIGLAVLLCLKAFGAKTISVSEIAAMRKNQASRFGVDAVFDPTKIDVVKKAKELCNGISQLSFYHFLIVVLVYMSHLIVVESKLLKQRLFKQFALVVL